MASMFASVEQAITLQYRSQAEMDHSEEIGDIRIPDAQKSDCQDIKLNTLSFFGSCNPPLLVALRKHAILQRRNHI